MQVNPDGTGDKFVPGKVHAGCRTRYSRTYTSPSFPLSTVRVLKGIFLLAPNARVVPAKTFVSYPSSGPIKVETVSWSNNLPKGRPVTHRCLALLLQTLTAPKHQWPLPLPARPLRALRTRKVRVRMAMETPTIPTMEHPGMELTVTRAALVASVTARLACATGILSAFTCRECASKSVSLTFFLAAYEISFLIAN